MKTRTSHSLRVPVAVIAVLAMNALRADAQNNLSASPPALPTVPTRLFFADRVAGRHLLFDTRTAYQSLPTVSYSAHWRSVNSGGKGENASVVMGTESVRAEASAHKIAVTSETRSPQGEHTVRRAIADGTMLLVTRFEEAGGKAEPKREFLRLSLDEGMALPRALKQVQFNFGVRADWLLLESNFAPRPEATVWRDKPTTINGNQAETVNEVDAPQERGNDRVESGRRYVIDAGTHRLLRFEEWQINRNPNRARPARKNRPAEDGTRLSYRREDYDAVSLSTKPLLPATYAQTLPASYKEQPLPAGYVQPPREPLSPEMFDSRALALLNRWRIAQERLLSLKTEAEVTFRATERTEQSRPLRNYLQDTDLVYRFTLEKPDRARIVMDTIKGGIPRQPRTWTAVSDGDQLRVVEDSSDARTMRLRENDSLGNRLNRAGLRDTFDALGYLFNGPPRADDYTRATYDGPAVLDGNEPVEVITLRQETTGNGPRRRSADIAQSLRIFFGKDGLPRAIESQRVMNVGGLFERDQPPVTTIVCRYRNVTVDSEPEATAFVLPAPPHLNE